ncbi:hypothetical protein B0E52_14280 [Rhodanobacter sp. C06]|nr:hypothetical protein B0E52_14280 [Rhodanobacter sp. C06]
MTHPKYIAQDTWSQDIAVLIADALVDAKVIDKPAMERAASIIAEEIFVRLTVGDYPPHIKE